MTVEERREEFEAWLDAEERAAAVAAIVGPELVTPRVAGLVVDLFRFHELYCLATNADGWNPGFLSHTILMVLPARCAEERFPWLGRSLGLRTIGRVLVRAFPTVLRLAQAPWFPGERRLRVGEATPFMVYYPGPMAGEFHYALDRPVLLPVADPLSHPTIFPPGVSWRRRFA